MALIEINTKTAGKSIEILFNDLSTQPNIGMSSAIIYRGNVIRLERNPDGALVVISELVKFDLAFEIVDTVNGESVNDNDELYQLLDEVITSNIA